MAEHARPAGHIVAPNLTPDVETGIGGLTDEQELRGRFAKTSPGPTGELFSPMMRYQEFRRMSDEDLASIVVYLRSLPPVRSNLGNSQIIFPVKYLIRGAPEPVTTPVASPDRLIV